jgi:tricorn protease interacting factor F2/3
LNYNLAFDIDFKSFRYKCKEVLTVQIKKSVKSIRLNAVGLKIKNAFMISKKKSQKATLKIDRKAEQLIVSFKNAVSGVAELEMEFGGANGDKLNGFYRSKYNVGKKENYILTTQFEPADARKAFPCFDEPGFKATFETSFLISKNLTAISNMPEKGTKRIGGKKLVTFRKTPKMSCYLLYFGIGEFERLKGKYRNVVLSVVTVPGKIKLGGTALEYGKRFLKYYEDYFGVRYPLPKMDLIAIPDFAISGMENWGAITYSEIALLTEKKATSVAAKQRIAEVVAHELAHQWFGDLVTMEWWNNLWLNESFATFMSYKAIDAVFPEWEMGVQATLFRTASALGADQLRSTQKIGVDVNNPGDMSEAFDPAITYNKGGAVLTMLEDYVGEERFRKGLQKYIKGHSYANATEHDLWACIGSIRGKGTAPNLDYVASYWINTPGYPIV